MTREKQQKTTTLFVLSVPSSQPAPAPHQLPQPRKRAEKTTETPALSRLPAGVRSQTHPAVRAFPPGNGELSQLPPAPTRSRARRSWAESSLKATSAWLHPLRPHPFFGGFWLQATSQPLRSRPPPARGGRAGPAAPLPVRAPRRRFRCGPRPGLALAADQSASLPPLRGQS